MTSVYLRFSYDNAGTFKSGGTDYTYANNYHAGATPTSGASNGAAFILLTNVLNSTTVGMAVIDIITVEAGSGPTTVAGYLFSVDAAGSNTASIMNFGGLGKGGYGRATHLRLTNAGGQTYTGKYTLEALFGYGE